jgi:hypothetical protein
MIHTDTPHERVMHLNPWAVPMVLALVPHLDTLDELQRRRVVNALCARRRASFDDETMQMVVSSWKDIQAGNPNRDAPHRVELRAAGLDHFFFEALDWCADLMHFSWREIEARAEH